MSSATSRGPITFVLGTRPEIIKLARITQLLGNDAHIVHTGQHYDANLSDSFFAEFAMRPPDTVIGVGGESRGSQIGNATTALDDLFQTLRPAAVVVQGDTNAVVAGALAANAREVPLVHVEAGLRSYDKRMPEEHNRIIADHLSDLCLAPTRLNVANLVAEGIGGETVQLTGNPIVEAVTRLLPTEPERKDLVESYGLAPGQFVLATFHRPENVDTKETLTIVIDALASLNIPVLLPLHPRTQQRIREFGLETSADKIQIVDPIGYRDFIGLGAASKLLVSDSGGVQEEVSVYKRRAVVIRRSTERQEVEGSFVRRLEPGPELPEQLRAELDYASDHSADLRSIPSPYGDVTAPEQSVAAIRSLVEATT